MSAAGQLTIVATPIGNLGDLSPRAAAALAAADVICCEDTRHTGQLLARQSITPKRLLSLHAHNEHERVAQVLSLLAEGLAVALCSDAGTPLVSDPGARLVAAVIDSGASVDAVPGPSALLVAFVLSGFSGRFCFEGFLARKGAERRDRLEAIARRSEATILYEAPSRVRATLSELAERCGEQRRVALCRELTKLHQEVWRGSLGEAGEANLVLEPRGEFVVVIEGSPRVAEQLDLIGALEALTAHGLSRRDAVAAVEVLLGAGHREAYELANELRPAPRQGAEPS